MQQKEEKMQQKLLMKKLLKLRKAIEQASTNSDVDQVKDKGTNGINSVVVEVLKKDEAKKQLMT